MTTRALHRHASATILLALVVAFSTQAAYADDKPANEGSGKFHPVDTTKKVAKDVGHGVKKTTKVIGHGFRDGARAVGHAARDGTRAVGHAFRDGAHKVVGKKDEK